MTPTAGMYALALAMLVLSRSPANADEDVHRLSLRDVVTHALHRHPTLGTAGKQENAADAKVGVARSEAFPKVGIVGQVNRSTGNLIPGATFGMPGIPNVAGPPGETRFGGGTWQTAAGVTAGWDVL